MAGKKQESTKDAQLDDNEDNKILDDPNFDPFAGAEKVEEETPPDNEDRGDAFEGGDDEAELEGGDAVGKAADSDAGEAEAEEADEPEDPDPDEGSDAEDEAEGSEGEEPDATDDDADADEDAGETAQADSEQTGKDHWIPKRRFDSVNERRKVAEEKLADLEAEIAELRAKDGDGEGAPNYDEQISAAEDAYTAAVIDGDADAAKAARSEIRKLEREQMRAELRDEVPANVQANREQRDYLTAAAELATDYPALDRKAEEFDKDLQRDVIATYQGLAQVPGTKPADALKRAAKLVLSERGIWTDDSVDAEAREKQQARTREKQEAAIRRNKKASNAQPNRPAKGRRGKGADEERSIDQLSEAEFDALPEPVKARMRGDLV